MMKGLPVVVLVWGVVTLSMATGTPRMRLQVKVNVDAWPELDLVSCEKPVYPARGTRCWSCRVRDALVFGVPVKWVTFVEDEGTVGTREYWIAPERVFDVTGMLTDYFGPPAWAPRSSWEKDEEGRDVLKYVEHRLWWVFELKGRRYRVELGGIWSMPPLPVSELVSPCRPRGLKGRWRTMVVEDLGPAGKGGKADGGEDREDAHEPRPQAPKK